MQLQWMREICQHLSDVDILTTQLQEMKWRKKSQIRVKHAVAARHFALAWNVKLICLSSKWLSLCYIFYLQVKCFNLPVGKRWIQIFIITIKLFSLAGIVLRSFTLLSSFSFCLSFVNALPANNSFYQIKQNKFFPVHKTTLLARLGFCCWLADCHR